MTQDDSKTNDPMDRDLWSTYRQAVAADLETQAAPDEMALAAYLEGKLEAREAAAVEAWLVAAPGALDQLIATRAALGEDSGPAPERVVRRAIRLILGEPPAARAFSWLWRPLAWSGAVAGLVLACGLGFQLGQAAYAGSLELEQSLYQEAGLAVHEATRDLL